MSALKGCNPRPTNICGLQGSMGSGVCQDLTNQPNVIYLRLLVVPKFSLRGYFQSIIAGMRTELWIKVQNYFMLFHTLSMICQQHFNCYWQNFSLTPWLLTFKSMDKPTVLGFWCFFLFSSEGAIILSIKYCCHVPFKLGSFTLINNGSTKNVGWLWYQ